MLNGTAPSKNNGSASIGKRSTQPVSWLSRDTKVERPNLAHGGMHPLHTDDGLWQSGSPTSFSAPKAVALGDASDPGVSDPKKVAMELHLHRNRAAAHQFRRVLVDAAGDNRRLLECAYKSVKPMLGLAGPRKGSAFTGWRHHVSVVLQRAASGGPAVFGCRDCPSCDGCVLRIFPFAAGAF